MTVFNYVMSNSANKSVVCAQFAQEISQILDFWGGELSFLGRLVNTELPAVNYLQMFEFGSRGG